jgi:hypothetical protein
MILVIVVILLIIGASTWVNYNFSLENPGGSDFLFGWVATQLFIKDGLNPYSEEVQIGIQERFYGRQPHNGEDELIFVYPFYAMSVFSPFALIVDYNLARALWMTTLEISTILIVMFSIKLVNSRFSTHILVTLLIFSILWYHGMRAIINGNIIVITTLFIVVSLVLIQSKYDFTAGLLIALASIKPNVIIMFVIFVSLWSLYHRRWRLFLGIFCGLMILIIASMFFVPDWILQNITQLISYSNIPTIGSPGEYIQYVLPGVGRQLRWLMTVVLGMWLLLEWRASLGKDFRWFLWTVCLTLILSQWIGITTDPGNYMLMLLPLILVLATIQNIWKKIGGIGVFISLVIIFFGLWILFLNTIEFSPQPVQHPFLFFPLPFMLLIGLYSIRRYATRPLQLILDNYSKRIE